MPTNCDIVIGIDFVEVESPQNVFPALRVALEVRDVFLSLARRLKVFQEEKGWCGEAVVVRINESQPSIPVQYIGL